MRLQPYQELRMEQACDWLLARLRVRLPRWKRREFLNAARRAEVAVRKRIS